MRCTAVLPWQGCSAALPPLPTSKKLLHLHWDPHLHGVIPHLSPSMTVRQAKSPKERMMGHRHQNIPNPSQ